MGPASSAGKPKVTEVEPPCGNRMVQEANVTRAKAQGKRPPTRSLHLAAYNPVDTSPVAGAERRLTWTR